jgi:hypothetical protein
MTALSRPAPPPPGGEFDAAAGVTTDITSTTVIELIGPAPDFSGVVQYQWSQHKFLPAFDRLKVAPG